MRLRPPPPPLPSQLHGRLELRKLVGQGVSVHGAYYHATDLHRNALRDLVVVVPPRRKGESAPDAVQVITAQGEVHHAVPLKKQTHVFRAEFYTQRRDERDRVRARWPEAELPASEPVTPAMPRATKPQTFDSPLDALNPMRAEFGWPFEPVTQKPRERSRARRSTASRNDAISKNTDRS